jgi:hypothetical protein
MKQRWVRFDQDFTKFLFSRTSSDKRKEIGNSVYKYSDRGLTVYISDSSLYFEGDEENLMGDVEEYDKFLNSVLPDDWVEHIDYDQWF